MEEDQTTTDIPSAITTKQRVLQARGHEVPLDYFLYSCLERERLEKATMGESQPHIAWPLLPKVGEEGPVAALQGPELVSLLKSLMTWYRENFPELTEAKAVDHEQLLKVVPPVVGLARDLARLYLEKTQERLPLFSKHSRPAQIWTDIETALKDSFPKIQHMVLRYLQWTHAEEVKEVFEPGSRPPVGRYAPPPLPRTMSRDGGRPERGGRPDRGPRSDGPRHDRPDRPQPEPRPAEDAQEGSNDREAAPRERTPRPAPSERGDCDRGPRPPRREGRPPRSAHPEGEEQTARLTAVALAEVDQAIAELETAGQPITLKPTNSFYRRLQHQKIVDAGYNSNSVGEGPDRAVQISRKDS